MSKVFKRFTFLEPFHRINLHTALGLNLQRGTQIGPSARRGARGCVISDLVDRWQWTQRNRPVRLHVSLPPRTPAANLASCCLISFISCTTHNNTSSQILITVIIIIIKMPNNIVHPESRMYTQISQLFRFICFEKYIKPTMHMYNTNFLQNIIVIQSAFHLNSTPLI
jgi:hypothetical protein